jgi:hypothetical protein
LQTEIFLADGRLQTQNLPSARQICQIVAESAAGYGAQGFWVVGFLGLGRVFGSIKNQKPKRVFGFLPIQK